MPTNILMPALSPTMEKGNLAKWLKKEGDQVRSGDVIAEIETDKATMEVEAADEGTLAKIVVPEGTQDVAVNSVIAVLAGEGEDVKAAAAGAAQARAGPESLPPHPSRRPQRAPQDEAKQRRRRHPSPPLVLRRPRTPPALEGRRPGRPPRARASSPRRSRVVWPRKPTSISRACRAPARMAASSRAISKRRNPARGCVPRPPRRRLPALHHRPWRRRCPTSKFVRSTRKAPTISCRTTACAAPSRSGSPPPRSRCRSSISPSTATSAG